jgi:4-hydroxybenzoate polyprenyltransferase
MNALFLNKIWIWSKLLRWHRPTGIFLLFFPCLWGHFWTYRGSFKMTDLTLLMIGAFWARSLGCLYNDFVDRDFDVQISRTQNRPLACGDLSVLSAQKGLVFLTLAGVLFVPFLNWQALFLGLFAVALSVFYPWTKRFFQMPQLILGIAFNMGVWMAWALSGRSMEFFSGFLLYGIGILWTLEYDTIYAYQDEIEDRKLGLKSLAVWISKKGRIFLWSCLFLRFLLGVLFFYKEGLGSAAYLLYSVFCALYALFYKKLRLEHKSDCLFSFHATLLWMGLFSVILFLGYASCKC